METWLDIDQQALPRSGLRITDTCYGTVHSRPRRGRAGLDPQRVELDPHSEIDPYLSDRVTEVLEMRSRILAGVADEDEAAPPAHHLVQAQIFEVAAVGEIRAIALDRVISRARIPQPPAQPDIEQGHDKTDQRRRVISHVWADR